MEKVGLLGIPYDDKSSFLKGPALAPPEIRKALHSESTSLYSENDILIDGQIYADYGDLEVRDYFNIREQVSQFLQQSPKMLFLGGDHSITYPVMKAIHKFHSNLEILHIDAHADLYDKFDGDRFSHGCPFARIMEENLATRLVQIGIRTLGESLRKQVDRFGVEVIMMQDFHRSALPKFKGPLYISLDLDALDPSCAPGVSHHEPGGMTSRELISLIQSIKVPVIGADIVEYNPVRDFHGMTAALAAKLMKEILVKMI